MEKVCIWADGDWCYIEELESLHWKSDDYKVFTVPEGCDDIEEWVALQVV